MSATNTPRITGSITVRTTPDTKAALEAIIKAQHAAGNWRANITTAVTSALLFYACTVAEAGEAAAHTAADNAVTQDADAVLDRYDAITAARQPDRWILTGRKRRPARPVRA